MRFTSKEVRKLIWESEVERIEGENRRWSRTNTSIVQTEDGKYYSVDWEEGLTEMQDNEYFDQDADEVKLVEEERLVKVREWVPVN